MTGVAEGLKAGRSAGAVRIAPAGAASWAAKLLGVAPTFPTFAGTVLAGLTVAAGRAPPCNWDNAARRLLLGAIAMLPQPQDRNRPVNLDRLGAGDS